MKMVRDIAELGYKPSNDFDHNWLVREKIGVEKIISLSDWMEMSSFVFTGGLPSFFGSELFANVLLQIMQCRRYCETKPPEMPREMLSRPLVLVA